MAATLESKYVARTGSPLLRDLLNAKIEQAMVDKAVLISREPNPSVARKAFAERALTQTASALAEITPFVTNNTVIADPAIDPTNSQIEYAVQTETIDGRYPPS